MQKIGDIPNTRADSNGEFTDGNVAGGVPPTILPAEWFNTIQREMISVLTAAGITPDSKKFDQVATAVSKLITDGGFLKATNNLSEIKSAGAVAQAAARANLGIAARFQKLTASGSFTVPAGVTTLYLSGCAGGGGGGGGSSATTSATAATCGGSGGAGESAQRVSVSVTPGQIIPVTIGNGGTAGAGSATGANASNGGSGGVTSFGSLLSLYPGSGGGGGIYGTSTVLGGSAGSGFPNGGWAMAAYATGGSFIMYSVAGSGSSTAFGGGGPAGTGGGTASVKGGDGFGYGSSGGGGGAFITTVGGSGVGKSGGAGAPGVLFVEW